MTDQEPMSRAAPPGAPGDKPQRHHARCPALKLVGGSVGAKRTFAGAVVVALVLAGCTPASGEPGSAGQRGGLAGQPLTVVPPGQRRPAPVATGPNLAPGGGDVSTGAYPGKVVVVNVWGSWCAPCRKEAPELVAASAQTADVAQFVGIDIRDYDPAPARAFVRAFAVPYPQMYDPQGAQLVKFTELPASGVPSTLFIDRRGRVAARIVGATTQTTLTQIVNDLAGES